MSSEDEPTDNLLLPPGTNVKLPRELASRMSAFFKDMQEKFGEFTKCSHEQKGNLHTFQGTLQSNVSTQSGPDPSNTNARTFDIDLRAMTFTTPSSDITVIMNGEDKDLNVIHWLQVRRRAAGKRFSGVGDSWSPEGLEGKGVLTFEYSYDGDKPE